MLFSILIVTVVTISLCLLASRWRLWITDYILICTVVTRGLTSYFIKRLLKDDQCISYLSHLLIKQLNVAFFFADLIIFRTNIQTSLYIAVPVFFGISSLNNRTRLKIMQENEMTICPTDNATIWVSQVVFLPIYLPLFCAVYLTALNELRLF
jgi:hypothetical protein